MTPVMVKWAPFAPDMSDYDPAFSDAIQNVEPLADGYGPLPAWGAIGTGLAAAPRGAWTVRLATGATALYAGTATKLYKYNAAALTWSEVTRLVGGDYACPDGVYWSGHQYGNILVVCNGTDDNQYINVDSGTNFAALTNSPKAFFVSSAGDHLLLGKLATDFRAMSWSGVNDAEYWTYGQRGSDTQVMPDGGNIQGFVPVGLGAMIFQQEKIRSLERVGGTYTFAIRVMHENLGCFSPYSILAARNTFFWYDQSGYYMGPEGTPIGAERVNRFVENLITSNGRRAMRGSCDPARNMVWWIIEKGDATNFLIGYDWVLQKWTQSNSDMGYIFEAISPGYTIDDLGSGGLGYTMDTIPYPFDSPFWQGTGIQSLAGMNRSGSYGYFQGTNQQATLETVDYNFNTGAYSFVQSIRAVCDAAYSLVSAYVGTRTFHGQAVSWSGAVTPDASSGRAWFRRRGMTHRFRTVIAPGDWYNSEGVLVYAKAAGKR